MPKEKRKFVVEKIRKAWKDKLVRQEDDKLKNPWGDALTRDFGQGKGKGGKKRKRS